MKTFSIYTHPDGRTYAIKQGWSWPAFFFGWIWALFKRLWLIGGITAVISIGVYAIFPNPIGKFGFPDFLNLAAMFFFGLKGNEWLRDDLAFRGFDFKDDITAQSSDHAMGIFLRKQTKTA